MRDHLVELSAVSSLRRRAVLRAAVAAAGATVVSAALAACGGDATSAPAPPATTGAAGGTAAPAGATTAAVTRPATSGSAPAGMNAVGGNGTVAPGGMSVEGRIPGTLPGVPDAYTKYPAPFKTVDAVPGRGGKVTAFLTSTIAPPPPRDRNRYWQELEKRLGVTWEPTLVAGGGYDEKFAALIAGGDLPDLVALVNTAPDQVRAIQQGAFTDLTSELSGEGLKQYPNLAAIPTGVWKNLAIKGKIYGVPKTRYTAGDPLLIRGDWLEKLGNPKITNADSFLDVMTQLTKTDFDGKGKPFALSSGVVATQRFSVHFFRQMFRVPFDWRVNADGSLTNWLETDEFRQCLDYMRKLYAAQIFHPDAATANSPQLKDGQVAGRFAAYGDTITGMPGQQRNILKVTPTAKIVGLAPPGFDGGKPTVYNSIGYNNYLGIPAKVGKDKERVKELLRLLNYWAAPFGSDEYTFVNSGIQGVHFDFKDGAPVRNDLGIAEISELSYTVNGPFPFFVADIPGYAQVEQQIATELATNGVDNPVLTLFSATNAAKGGELNQLYIDRVNAIVPGREPLTALDAWVKDWRSRGGDMIRKEYQDALKA